MKFYKIVFKAPIRGLQTKGINGISRVLPNPSIRCAGQNLLTLRTDCRLMKTGRIKKG